MNPPKSLKFYSSLFILFFLTIGTLSAQNGIYGAQWKNWTGMTQNAVNADMSWMRTLPALHWYEIEPTQNAAYNWPANYDTYLSTAVGQGLNVIATIQGTPTWAKKNIPGAGSGHCVPIDDAYMQDWIDFVTATVNKYKTTGVQYWEVWNEPDAHHAITQNVFGCWGSVSSVPSDQQAAGQYYGKFLAAAYNAIKAADPNAQVISGGLLMSVGSAPDGAGSVSLNFFEGVLQHLEANNEQGFDLAAFHNYGSWWGWGTDWDQTSECGGGARIVCRHKLFKKLLNQYGRNPEIIMNEGGLNCNPSFYANCTANQTLFEADKSNYMMRTTTRAMTVGIKAFIWYTLQYPGWRMGGLLGPGQSPRPVYNAMDKIAPMLSGSTFLAPVGSGQNYEGYLFRNNGKDYRVYWTASGPDVATEVMPAGATRYVKMGGDGNMNDLGVPSTANIDYGPLIIESAPANIDMQAQSTYVKNGELSQAYWRGNYGFYRGVPLAGSSPDWENANDWGGPVASSALPGSGDIQAQSSYILGGKFHQAFWRGNQGYYRSIPMIGNTVDWANAPQFSGPIPASALPGSGNMQAQSSYIFNNKLHQAFWRGNQGFYRSVQIVNNQPDWANAPQFSGPIPGSALPGSGNMQAQSSYILNNHLHQAFWRGNEGYFRKVPIVGGTINWGGAPTFSGPVSPTVLPVGPN